LEEAVVAYLRYTCTVPAFYIERLKKPMKYIITPGVLADLEATTY
jgi:hypothetical protein